MQDYLNLYILPAIKGTFLLDMAQVKMVCCIPKVDSCDLYMYIDL